jgi:hypothetical protein
MTNCSTGDLSRRAQLREVSFVIVFCIYSYTDVRIVTSSEVGTTVSHEFIVCDCRLPNAIVYFLMYACAVIEEETGFLGFDVFTRFQPPRVEICDFFFWGGGG